MHVIVPCAGSSSRFPDMPPKWMLPDHDGTPMVVRAVAGLGLPTESLIFTILQEHVDRFNALEGLQLAFGTPVRCVVLDHQTSSQSETVALTIKHLDLSGPFMVKDSDNGFILDTVKESYNYVSVASLHDFDLINARNKSYVQIDQDGLVTCIREKQVISDLFSVGGYFFQDASDFLAGYEQLNAAGRLGAGELYLSEIIAFMILNGSSYRTKRVQNYEDWGTIHEWRKALEQRRMYLISVDGFLFERGSSHFTPHFANVRLNEGAAVAVRKMADEQHTLVYLSIRPPELEELTRRQLREHGLPEAPMIFGCGVAPWALVTSGHATLPFNTSGAYEIEPDDVNVLEKLNMLR